MNLIMPHSYGIKKNNEKKRNADKEDLWRLQHAMRFIMKEPKQENSTTVVPESDPSRG